MKAIKFSHNYHKLPKSWEGSLAILTSVTPKNIDELKTQSPAFIDYDTTYINDTGIENKYPLNFKEGLILFFIHIKTGQPFTTIRRDYPEKRKYYQQSIGETFYLENPNNFEEQSCTKNQKLNSFFLHPFFVNIKKEF